MGGWRGRPLTPRGRRAVPLAVHGPLVEFDRRLFTATAGVWRSADGTPDRELLHLGSAVEVGGRTWYQAGTRATDGGGTVVEEWRLEFGADPRTAAEGAATARGHRRPLAESAGEVVSAAVRFRAEPPDERTRARVVRFVRPDGRPPADALPYLVIGDDRGTASVIWVDGQDRLSLSPAPPQGAELVQPPAK